MSNDYFAHKADSYEKNKSHVDNVASIANAIISSVTLKASMHLMDFGSGTGLLLERIAPYVRKITAVDVSSSMNEQLIAKQKKLACDLKILEIDLETSDIDQSFDGIVSSMTLHHVKNIEAIFKKFHALLKDDGFIALSDLDSEDGSFHTEDTGVFHFGFSREDLVRIAKASGFKNVAVTNASVVHKPQGDFPVFLLTATAAPIR